MIFLLSPAVPTYSGAEVSETGKYWEYQNDFYSFKYHKEQGIWDLFWADGRPAVKGATAHVTAERGGKKGALRSQREGEKLFDSYDFKDRVGEGTQLEVTHSTKGGVEMIQSLRFYRGEKFITARVAIGGS